MKKTGEYWEKRYALGGISGAGSIGLSRDWKWKVITSVLPEIDHIIDVGCGDLTFWEGRSCKDYTGIDISKTVIEGNRKKRPNWNLIVSPAETYINGVRSECVFCLDTLFHIMDDNAFMAILKNLCFCSTKYIFIHTWFRNPLTMRERAKKILATLKRGHIKRALIIAFHAIITPYTDGRYQYYRQLEQYMNIFKERNFTLIEKRENSIDNIGAMYIFKQVN